MDKYDKRLICSELNIVRLILTTLREGRRRKPKQTSEFAASNNQLHPSHQSPFGLKKKTVSLARKKKTRLSLVHQRGERCEHPCSKMHRIFPGVSRMIQWVREHPPPDGRGYVCHPVAPVPIVLVHTYTRRRVLETLVADLSS